MDFIREFFQYQFLINALIASLLSGIVCGIVGSYIVARRLVFLSGGITHASFGGIGIAFYMGINPILGALLFAPLAALTIEWGATRGRMREDSMIGVVWSVGMALGVMFVYLTPGYAPNLMSFLFGNILTVTTIDIIALAGLTLVVGGLFALMLRPIIYVAFDREYAATQGVAVKTISYMMAIVVALTIVLSIRTVGIVLLISLLTMPPVIVNSMTKSYVKILLGSIVVATLANLIGLGLSYSLNIPAGAATVLVLAVVLIVVKSVLYLERKRRARRKIAGL